jgi:hypothetical protein
MSHQNLTKTNDHQKFMNENLLYLQFTKAITIYNSQLATYQQCFAKVVEAYWINHKPICFVFKPPQLHPTLLTHKFNLASISTNGFFLRKITRPK